MARCQQAQAPPPPPPPPAAFGTTNANASETVELSQLTVAAVESGSSGQPQLVRQAFLASVNATTSAAGGRQTVSIPRTRILSLDDCELLQATATTMMGMAVPVQQCNAACTYQ